MNWAVQAALDGLPLDPVDFEDIDSVAEALDRSRYASDEQGERHQDRECFRKARMAFAVRYAVRLSEPDSFANVLYELAYSTEDIDAYLELAARVTSAVLRQG